MALEPVMSDGAQRVPHLTVEEHVARGKAARSEVSRSTHAAWAPAASRVDPIALLQEQAQSRVPELVPIRHGRMLASPFAYFRGAAYAMAADLAATPTSGLRVQMCGDAHLANFGGFASPERSLVFDINDFDETLPGPWEWDVMRLLASIAIAGRERGFSVKDRESMLLAAARGYREAMSAFAAMTNLDVWYAHLSATEIRARVPQDVFTREQVKQFDRTVARAPSRGSAAAVRKLTERVNGETRIVSKPPLIVPIEELLPESKRKALEDSVLVPFRAYRRSLQGDRRRLLESYRFVHLARKVVGVGSVGTRTWIGLFIGRDDQDSLVLQFKEAQASVHEPFVGASAFRNHGQRVVEGQRLMQAASDIFLGWFRSPASIEGEPRDYYVRQLWDWKVSPDVGSMPTSVMSAYGAVCAWTLARAHACSGDRIAIAAYLGTIDVFDRALATFAERYADQNERDHAALAAAVRDGRLAAAEVGAPG